MDEPISPRWTTPTCQTKIRVHSVPQNGVGLISRGVALLLAALPAADEVISAFLRLCFNDDGQECFQDKVQSNMSHLRTGTTPSQDRVDVILKENVAIFSCFVQTNNELFLLHRPGLLLKVKDALLTSGGYKFVCLFNPIFLFY